MFRSKDKIIIIVILKFVKKMQPLEESLLKDCLWQSKKINLK